MMCKKNISMIIIIFILISVFNIFSNTSYAETPLTIGSLPAGSIVYDPTWTWEHKTGNNYSGSGTIKPIEWLIVAKNHTGYPSNSVTLLSNELIGKYTFDNKHNPDPVFPGPGFGHWGNSNALRPWLNETFYNKFSNEFKSEVLDTIARNVDDKGVSYTTTDKILIPSHTELGVTDNYNTYTVGSNLNYFKTDIQRIGYINHSATSYYTRSPYSTSSRYIRIIDSYGEGRGNVNSNANSIGVRPIINVKDNIQVKFINGNKYEIVYNKAPNMTITQPIKNQRIGNQDNLIISGIVKDENIGDTLNIKYTLKNIINSNITLTQPTTLISNGQTQSFQGYIQLDGLGSGNNILKLWVEDNQGAKSSTTEISIVAFNTLENVLESLKSYTYKAGEPQVLIINSNAIIIQNAINDNLINQIKRELEAKNVKLFFIGQDGQTENYIKSKLLSN